MQFSLISIAIVLVSISTTHSASLQLLQGERTTTMRPSRPVQTFFKKILDALRPTTTPEPLPSSTTKRIPTYSFHTNVEYEEIPNFVDFSTFLLESFAVNNTAIKFTYLEPTKAPTLKGNFSVISFLVPHNTKSEEQKTKGIFSFLNSLKLPWSQRPQQPDSDVSRFPPILEYFTQRIQAYFSVYKYADDSRVNNTIVVFADDGLENSPNTNKELDIPNTEVYQMDTTLDTSTTTTDVQDVTTTEIISEME
jgi:hypothetical protein